MAILTKPTPEGAHWYTLDGKPCHDQPTKSGDGTRRTTVQDAKRLHLLPSVTSVISVLAKPKLETWKQKQVALACLASPKQPTESVDYWLARVLEASKAETSAAADLGSQIHAALDEAFDGTPPTEDLAPYVQPVLAWLAQNGVEMTMREVVLTDPAHGYAGRVDALFRHGPDGRPGVLDYKTRKTEPGKAVTPYDGQAMQLAAYAAAAYGADKLGTVWAVNVYISTTEPGRVEVCTHDNLNERFLDFLAAARLWRAGRGYDPRARA